MTLSPDSHKSQAKLPIAEDVESSKQEAESSPSSPATPAPFYAEGGMRAWLVVLGCWCVSFASFGIVNTFGYESGQAWVLRSFPDVLQCIRNLLFEDLSPRLFSLYCCLDRLDSSLGSALSYSNFRSHQ